MEWPLRRGIRTRQIRICHDRVEAELLTAIVSGTSRRNVLGAIAFEKNDCNFPQRSDDNRDESKNNHHQSHDKLKRSTVTSNQRKETGDYVGANTTQKNRRETVSA
jgi:hypothetical protein